MLVGVLLASVGATVGPIDRAPRERVVPAHGSVWISRDTSVARANTRRPMTTYLTVSRALDRLDQRGATLDGQFRHAGSGRGVTVYVFDGGILATHPDLAGRVRRGYDAFAPQDTPCNGHGTAVAGAIGGTTLGVAPEVALVDVVIIHCATQRGTVRAMTDGVAWVLADHARHGGPAIVNWSLVAKTDGHVRALDRAVAALEAAGLAVVVAAGNVDQDACRISPANAPGALVVGASTVAPDTMDTRVQGTARGPCVPLYAPGENVLVPSLEGRAMVQPWTGTSMAAGYVSGALALRLEASPGLSPQALQRSLLADATPGVMHGTGATTARLLYVGPLAAPSVFPALRSSTRPAPVSW
jgi:subtilisin family serine protease